MLCLAVGACATPSTSNAPVVPTAAKYQLAPSGVLRVGINGTNPMYVTPGSGPERQGLVPDIARALATQLGARVEFVDYPTAPGVVAAAKNNEWDIAFMGYAQERVGDVDFTPIVVQGENSYVVRNESPLRHVDDVDRAGIRIAVSARTVQHIFLQERIRNATLVPMANNAASMQAFASGAVDAVAGNKLTALDSSASMPGSRVLDGSFMHVPYALAVNKGRPAGAAYATEFVRYLRDSGAIEQSVRRAKLGGVTVGKEAGAY